MSEKELQPGAVLYRDLDDEPFAVVLLRVRGTEADVVYMDDGNVERDVPFDDLTPVPEIARTPAMTNTTQHLADGLALLAAEEETEAQGSCGSRPTTAKMDWEQGRYVTEDGAVILSAAAVTLQPDLYKDLETNLESAACGTGLRGIRCLRRSRLQVQAPAAA